MPLDSHSYLVSQGWGGKGTGLRRGAISKPLAIPQKKTLAGLGKDRDEAFPFWDHLFSAAAKSIQIKCLSDDEGDNGISTINPSNNDLNTSIKCTSTGIFSNRRPLDGTPATSGTITPENPTLGSQSYRLGLLATAKRDAAKRHLYSKFFRGPVLGPDTIIEQDTRMDALVSQAFSANDSIANTVSVQGTIDVQTADLKICVDLEDSKSLKKKRKSHETKGSGSDDEGEKTKTEERKRRRKDKKEKKANSLATEKRKEEKHRGKTGDAEANFCTLSRSSPKDQKIEEFGIIQKTKFSAHSTDDHENQADHKRKKREKKRLKRLEKAQTKGAEKIYSNRSKSLETKSFGNPTKPEEIRSATGPEVLEEPKKRKKKRKYADAEL